ncbi:mechanosensitive ion channel [Candidatus Woesearchaeota archaeon]|nr:mechanosensitive ion channel [Candidatus Woesearchaeota archaeon]
MSSLINSTVKHLNLLSSQIFTRLIVAVIILLIGFIIGKLVSRLVQKVLQEIELNSSLKKAGVKLNLETIVSHFIAYFIYFIAVVWALNEIGLTTTVLNMISASAMVLIIISIVLAIKDFIPNAFAGLFIYQKGFIKEGDTIKVDNVEGTVKKTSLIETEIETKENDSIYIPNSILTKKEVTIRK